MICHKTKPNQTKPNPLWPDAGEAVMVPLVQDSCIFEKTVCKNGHKNSREIVGKCEILNNHTLNKLVNPQMIVAKSWLLNPLQHRIGKNSSSMQEMSNSMFHLSQAY